MHLIRLLKVSDTFTAGEIPVGRYHVVGLSQLPRFGSRRPAFRSTTRQASERSAEREPAGADLAQPEPGRPGWIRRSVFWLARRLERKRNPFGQGGLRVTSTVRPTQACLRLDQVKVVRNDLTDSDTVVQAGPKAGRDKQRELMDALSCDFRQVEQQTAEATRMGAGGGGV